MFTSGKILYRPTVSDENEEYFNYDVTQYGWSQVREKKLYKNTKSIIAIDNISILSGAQFHMLFTRLFFVCDFWKNIKSSEYLQA